MTDQFLSQPIEINTTPIVKLMLRLKALFSANADTAANSENLSSDNVSLDGGQATSRRLRKDVGMSEEYRTYDTRNEVANIRRTPRHSALKARFAGHQ